MARWWRGPRWVSRNAEVIRVGNDALTAAAQIVNADAEAFRGGRTALLSNNQGWQVELWDRYDDCGEFGLAVNWRANMMSRIRLTAARYKPGLDEPEPVTSGLAADLVNELFTDVGGQSDALSALSTYLDVPGEGWIVGEHNAGVERWRTCSRDELRARADGYEMTDESSLPGREVWRKVGADALIVRVWRPHRRRRHEPYSTARAALSAIRELDLVNRHIQAQYLSRLASAGLIILPDELTFPTREEFKDAPDPFVAEWIATAKEAIATPGIAAAVVPIPMRVPAEYVDKVHHIDFTLKIDERIIEKRDAARKRLASIINVPTELLFDSGSINHWGLWQLEESAVKTYITPDFELIVNALTIGYLHPRMRAAGEDPTSWTVWYDASEIITRPDVSDNVVKAYDRLEVTGRALRREIGLDESDKPSLAEIAELALKKLAVNPTAGFAAIAELTGRVVEVATGVGAASPSVSGTGDQERPQQAQQPADEPSPASGPPNTKGNPPRTPRNAADAERTAFTILQARSQHVIEFYPGGHTLRHPLLCAQHLFSCPFTHATYHGVSIRPGTSGNYACTLTTEGGVSVGQRIFPSDDAWIVDPPRLTNGVTIRG